MLAEKYYFSTQTLDWLQDWNETDSMLDFVDCVRLNSLYLELTDSNWKWEKTNIRGFSLYLLYKDSPKYKTKGHFCVARILLFTNTTLKHEVLSGNY